jgi:hypothetical protein
MKKSDLLKLAVLGISSASIMSSQVFADSNGSSGAKSGGQNEAKTQSHGCSNIYGPDYQPAQTSDGKTNYTSSTSTSLQPQTAPQNGAQKTLQQVQNGQWQ